MKNHFIKYSIDHLNSERITGWCFSKLRKLRPAKLSFFADGELLGTATADNYREDLEYYGLHPNGRCGLEFCFADEQRLLSHARLTVHVNGARTPLQTVAIAQIPQVMKGDLPTVFFMHIPKTGGTTLNAFALQYFPDGAAATHIEVLDCSRYRRLGATRNYLAGHLPLQKIKQHFDTSAFDLVTLMRDPYRQLHSHMSWIKGIAADRCSEFFLKHEQCVRDLAVRLHETDLSINAKLEALVEHADGFELDFFDNLQTRYFLDYRPDKISALDLSHAVANAGSFELVGTAEKLDRFLDRFCNRYGMARTEQIRTFNRSSTPRLFDYDDDKVRSILTPFVEADRELYDLIAEQ